MTIVQFYLLTIPTRSIDENKQNGRIFFKDRQTMVAHQWSATGSHNSYANAQNYQSKSLHILNKMRKI